MFDTDGNKLIDYDEFKMLESIFRQSAENNAEEQVRLHHLNMIRQSTFVIHTRDMISFVKYRSHIPSYSSMIKIFNRVSIAVLSEKR